MSSNSKSSAVTLSLSYMAIAVSSSIMTYFISKQKLEKSGQSNTVQNAITTRRTVEWFDPILPPDWEEKVKISIEAAITAPNHRRPEPWRFYLLNRETWAKVCELVAARVTEKQGPKAGAAKFKKWMKVPGQIVITCVKQNPERDHESLEDARGKEREDYAACCCAAQNMTLSLHSNGLSSLWCSAWYNDDKRYHELVGIPDSEYVVGTFWFGNSMRKLSKRQRNLTVDDVYFK